MLASASGFLVLMVAALGAMDVVGQSQPNCPQGAQSCGDSCYYSAQYYCYEGNYLCPVNNGTIWQRCNEDCYDPNAYACANGTALVQTGNNTSGNVQCGDAWYNPKMYVCDYNGPNSDGTLCPRKPDGETSQACGTACFYPDQYTCDQSTQTLSPTNGNTGAN